MFLCFIDIKSAFDLVSYGKLFCVLCDRGTPKYLILLLLNWYSLQKLFIKWDGAFSNEFGMKNGIRQGSCLSPQFFSVYSDELNSCLASARIGCHISGRNMNHLSYADDMVLITADAKSMNLLLGMCEEFAGRNYVTFSTTKTEAMVVKPRGSKLRTPPDIWLCGVKIKYVNSFKYLGHIVADDMTDDLDICREIRNLYVRGNTIARKFSPLSMEVKASLFKSYCYPLYTSALWSNYRQGTINRMRVCYNDVVRMLAKVPRWHSASEIFVNNNLRSFWENIRAGSYSLMNRVINCDNLIVQTLFHSDAYTFSPTRIRWYRNLFSSNVADVLYPFLQ